MNQKYWNVSIPAFVHHRQYLTNTTEMLVSLSRTKQVKQQLPWNHFKMFILTVNSKQKTILFITNNEYGTVHNKVTIQCLKHRLLTGSLELVHELPQSEPSGSVVSAPQLVRRHTTNSMVDHHATDRTTSLTKTNDSLAEAGRFPDLPLRSWPFR